MGKLLSARFKPIMVGLIVFMLLTGCMSSYALPKNSSELSQLNLKKLLQKNIKQYDIPGAVLAVTLGNGQTSIVKAGDAQVKPRQAISDHQLFSIGSVTKLFTATTIMQLIDQYPLQLQDTLAVIAKRHSHSDLYILVKQYPHLKHITLKQLLNHTSGLHSAVNSDRFAKLFNQNPLKVWSQHRLIKLSLLQKPYFKPGAKGMFHYTSVDYYLVGKVITAVTGKPAYQVINKMVHQVGLKHTYIPHTQPQLPKWVVSHLAQGYMTPQQPLGWSKTMINTLKNTVSHISFENNGDTLTLYNVTPICKRYMQYAFPAGGIISTPSDISLFYHKLFNGDIVGSQALKQITTGTPVNASLDYGLGIFINKLDAYKHLTVYYHGGDMPGYRAMAVFIPRYNMAIAIMTNLETAHLDSLTTGLMADVLHRLLAS